MKKNSVLRDVWLAVFLLLLLFSLTLANTLIYEHIVGTLIEKAEELNIAEDCGALSEQVKLIEEEFDRWNFFMGITVNHDDIGRAESELIELVEAIESNDATAARIAKSRLIGALKQLRRLSGAGIDSII